MKKYNNFILSSELISEFLCNFSSLPPGEMIKEIIQANNEDGNEYDLSMFEGLEHWRFNIESDSYIYDDGNNDNLITIIDPETGDGYFGTDNHNLMNGWSDVQMFYHKYDPNTDMVEISRAELDNMKSRIEWLEALENAGVDNWSGYGMAWEMMGNDNN